MANSGNFSGMGTSDKKFHLQIYPSPKWITFEKLFNFIKKENSKHLDEKR
jgi:hypothetical protein